METLSIDNLRNLGPPLEEDANERIDKYLSIHFPFFTRSSWQKRIQKGEVFVNFKTIKRTYPLKAGDQVQYYYPKAKEPEVNKKLSVLWKEKDWVAINKPAPLPMHEGGPYRKNTFTHLLAEFVGPEWSPVHRLDRETSGIVICARTPDAKNQISELFREQKMEKTYLAIAKLSEGALVRSHWSVDEPIGDLADSEIRIKKWICPDGQPALTHFSLVGHRSDLVLLKAKPKTGRTNQIRIHAAVSGFTLLGDKLYHPDESVFLEFYEKGNTENVISQAGFYRHCLHAAQLKFDHPESGKRIIIRAPLSEDMRNIWKLCPL